MKPLETFDIFISYSRADTAFADILDARLQSQGYVTWIDRRKIGAGQRWNQEIQGAIDRSRAMVVILSPDGVASPTVNREFAYALDEKKTVIPVRLQECRIPFLLNGIHWADFLEQEFDLGFNDLLRSLDSYGVHPSSLVLGPARTARTQSPSVIGAPVAHRRVVAGGWLINLILAIGLATLFLFIVGGRAQAQIVSAGILVVLVLLASGMLILDSRQNNETRKALESMAQVIAYKDVVQPYQASGLTGRLDTYSTQADAYRFLEDYLETHPARQAVLLQYSGISSRSLLRALLRTGTSVTLYIQHQDTASAVGMKEQAERIEVSIRFLRGELGGLYDATRLKIYRFRPPSSISGVKLDADVLCMGWYTYEYVDDSNQSPYYLTDSSQLSGHDVAAVMCWKGSAAFAALDQTFTMLQRSYEQHAEEVTPP
jgi:hypothetical protein